MNCRKCHYRLAGLTHGRCPECGREFDPDDPSSFLTAASNRSGRLSRVFACVVIVTGTLVLLGSCVVSPGAAYAGLAFANGVAQGDARALLILPVLLTWLGMFGVGVFCIVSGARLLR